MGRLRKKTSSFKGVGGGAGKSALAKKKKKALEKEQRAKYTAVKEDLKSRDAAEIEDAFRVFDERMRGKARRQRRMTQPRVFGLKPATFELNKAVVTIEDELDAFMEPLVEEERKQQQQQYKATKHSTRSAKDESDSETAMILSANKYSALDFESDDEEENRCQKQQIYAALKPATFVLP